MNQALLYLKTNQPVCLFTNSKDFKISPSSQEKSGVSNVNWTVNHPVDTPDMYMFTTLLFRTALRVCAARTHNQNRKPRTGPFTPFHGYFVNKEYALEKATEAESWKIGLGGHLKIALFQ